MSDLIPLYSDFMEYLCQGNEISIETFQHFFDHRQIEYLHYCGSSIAAPFLLDIERDLFQLAAAYLYFPKQILLPNVRLFSLLLLFFLYGTQPLLDSKDLPPFPIVIATDILDSLFSHPPSARSTIQSSPKVASPASRAGVETVSLEESIVLSLYDLNAFSIQPSVDNKAYVTAIIRAHECSSSAPIFRQELRRNAFSLSSPYNSFSVGSQEVSHTCNLRKNVPFIGDSGLKKMLLEYESDWEKNKDLLR